ncbi:MAG: choice-of-anchor L domain-containing protein [Bacteroidota bacterium]
MKKFYHQMMLAMLIAGAAFSNATAQLTTSTTLTPTQLVQTILLGSGVQAFNITYTGVDTAIGSFNGAASNIGLAGGVTLSSGPVINSHGPQVCSPGVTFGTAGDVDLNSLTTGTTQDAAILEFDFVPIGDTVKFRYVFGSEEYPQYVATQWNDVFGFFISGPGIVGNPNIAMIPTTVLPVTINNLNNGQTSCGTNPSGPCSYCAYYIDNTGGLTVYYTGFTVPMVAQHWVIPCDTYHIKIAIADVGDGAYDSGVFLEQGSFSGGSSVFVTTHPSTIDSMVVEGCVPGSVIFSILQPLNHDTTIYFTVGGTATNGTDYNHIADSLVIPAGQIHDTLIINGIADNISEPTETIVFGVTYQTGCSTYVTDSVLLYIRNVDSIQVTASHDTTICTGQHAVLSASAIHGYGAYSYVWDHGAGSSASVNVMPTSNTTYHVTVTDYCGNTATAATTVSLIFAAWENGPDTIAIEGCKDGKVVFSIPSTQSSPYVVHFLITGTATNGVDYTLIPDSVTIIPGSLTDTVTIHPIVDNINEPNETVIFLLPIPSSCGGGYDTVRAIIINVDPIALNVSNDTTICYGHSTNLNALATGGYAPLGYSYTWDHGLGSSASVSVSPSTTTVYNVSVIDSCGNTINHNVTVSVVYGDNLVIVDAPAVATCKDGKVVFSLPLAFGVPTTITYTLGGSGANGIDYANLTGSITIPAGQTVDTLIIAGLVNLVDTTNKYVTITIHLPSACGPDITINMPLVNVQPMRLYLTSDTVLCLGQQVDLNARVYGGYNGYVYDWNQSLGGGSSQVVTPNSTTVYTVAVNDSCGHHLSDSVQVRIIPHPITGLTVTPPDSMCSYDQAVITVHDTLVGAGFATIDYSPGKLVAGSAPGPYTISYPAGYYTIKYLAVSEKNCFRDSTMIDIFVKDCDIYVPNVFTPNGDGKNDKFVIINMDEFPNSKLVIFNRWGLKVYENTNYRNDWTGGDAPDGTYYYILYLNTGDIRHGSLTVIR